MRGAGRSHKAGAALGRVDHLDRARAACAHRSDRSPHRAAQRQRDRGVTAHGGGCGGVEHVVVAERVVGQPGARQVVQLHVAEQQAVRRVMRDNREPEVALEWAHKEIAVCDEYLLPLRALSTPRNALAY